MHNNNAFSVLVTNVGLFASNVMYILVDCFLMCFLLVVKETDLGRVPIKGQSVSVPITLCDNAGLPRAL